MLSARPDLSIGKAAGTEDSRLKGFTLIDLIIAIIIIGVLSALGYIGVKTFLERSQISAAVADIRNIDLKIKTYFAERAIFPSTLADLEMGGRILGNLPMYIGRSPAIQNRKYERTEIYIRSTRTLIYSA
jgi:prepilin-type N-terminal cleavage/methylation domain-containing protein